MTKRKAGKSVPPPATQLPNQSCPQCGSSELDKAGFRYDSSVPIQRLICKNKSCSYRFSEHKSNKQSQTRKNRQVCVTLQGAKNLTQAREIETLAGELQTLDVKGKIVECMFYMQKKGLAAASARASM